MSHALIIDDDLSNLNVLKQLLTIENVSYTAIHDSTQVEAALSLVPAVDVVLLDLEMPDIDGYQLFEIIHNHPQMQGVPVVACTVHTGEVQTARQIGFHSFISKPLNMDKFGQQLARVLSNEPVWETT